MLQEGVDSIYTPFVQTAGNSVLLPAVQGVCGILGATSGRYFVTGQDPKSMVMRTFREVLSAAFHCLQLLGRIHVGM